MNAQITFKFSIFNLETDLSAEELGKAIHNLLDAGAKQIIEKNAKNKSWIFDIETFVKDNVPIPENVQEVFDANDIKVGENP